MGRYKKVKRENNSCDQSLINSTDNSLDDVPLDIALDILMRLPIKSIARLLLVSKFWSETIRSRHFITSFQNRYSLQQQPRLLVVFNDIWRKPNSQDSYFFSLSSSSTTSYLSRVTSPFQYPVSYSHYVNGLICLGSGLNKCVANPSTGTCSVLPGDKTELERSFFGYDSVNDEYKLLVCIGKMKRPSRSSRIRGLDISSYSHHQVVTMGAKNEAWRRIDYKTRHHHPVFNSVCIDGVLYYVAFTGSDLSKLSLMRFHLESEKLDLFTSLSPDVRAESLHGSTLISYKNKVALATKISTIEHEVWVLDQHEWVKKSFFIKMWVHRKVPWELYIRGSTLTGEFILAPRIYSDMFCVIYYNPDTNCYRRTDVEVQGDYDFKHRGTIKEAKQIEAMVFPDYIDCGRFFL